MRGSKDYCSDGGEASLGAGEASPGAGETNTGGVAFCSSTSDLRRSISWLASSRADWISARLASTSLAWLSAFSSSVAFAFARSVSCLALQVRPPCLRV